MIVLPDGTFAPTPTWSPLEVTVKATGEKQIIKSTRFNPEIHSHAKELNAKPIEITTEKEADHESMESEDAPAHIIITAEDRHAFLKNKGWKNLDKMERVDYQKLKGQFEPK